MAWAIYDAGHSAVPTLIQTFLFAAYFTRAVAENETVGTACWGNAIGVAGIIVAIGSPVLGAVADQAGRHKAWVAGFTLLTVVATALLWLIRPAPEYIWPALVLVAVVSLASESSFVFYNAMLPGLASRERLGRWSGWGWAMGYAGGLACLFIALLAFVAEDAWLSLPREDAQHVRATCLLAALWLLVFSLPVAESGRVCQCKCNARGATRCNSITLACGTGDVWCRSLILANYLRFQYRCL